MSKKYLYFQPQYVREFVCDGSKCPNNCCKRSWDIEVDAQTYEKYLRVKPESKARELANIFARDAKTGKSLLRKHPCPLLTEQGWCSLQLEYGEDFLSLTCMTFPRFTWNFGKFFERSLSLTCPLAAEMILFHDEPLSFELLETVEDDQAKVGIMTPPVPHEFAAHVVEIQIAMISILQERTLTLDQRLIVLGFFLDRLDEIISGGLDVDALTKLIAAYESKNFLSEQVPRMLATVNFDAKNFSRRMLEALGALKGNLTFGNGQKLFDADEKFSVAKLADDCQRKNFASRYATLLENFLVNELFLSCFPWRFQADFAKNFGVFVATYKLFELLTFAAVQKNLCGKDELLRLVDWFANQTDHAAIVNDDLLKQFTATDDIFSSLETFLEAT